MIGDARRLEGVEVGHVAHDPLVDELLDEARAQVIDVHREPAGEVEHPLLDLLGAVAVWAACRSAVAVLRLVRVAQHAHDRRPARGALLGHLELRRVPLARGRVDLDDLRDDLARLLDHRPVAHADVEGVDHVGVVQRRARHGGAGELHRVERRHRGERSGAADLDVDRPQARARPLRHLGTS